jgi:hypothetical protein
MTASVTSSVAPREPIVDLPFAAFERRTQNRVFPSYFAVPRDFFSSLCDEHVTTPHETFSPRPNEFHPQSPNVAVM